MEIPIEILMALGTVLTGGIGAIGVYIKKRLDELDTMRNENSKLMEKNAILETEKRLFRSHGKQKHKSND